MDTGALTAVMVVPFLAETLSRKLQAGANDVRALAPSIYFVREASGVEREASRVTKVVVTR